MVAQGDIIKLDLNPVSGHEQAGYRPAIVISNILLSRASNMVIVCPITNTNRNNPLHFALKGTTTTGYVMTDQLRAVDLRSRPYKYVESLADEDLLWNICDTAQGLVEFWKG